MATMRPPEPRQEDAPRFSRRWLLAAGVGATALSIAQAGMGVSRMLRPRPGKMPNHAGMPGNEDVPGKAGPTTETWRFPAEWEPHDATLMSMPHIERIYGRRKLRRIQREWANVARAIDRFEPVIMVIPPGAQARSRMRELLGRRIRLLQFHYDDGWLRDNGPIFLVKGSRRLGLDFEFNGWGGAFDAFGQTWKRDNALPKPLCDALGIRRRHVSMVLEGGAIQCDGQGTIITTEECLLNPNRNPGMTKAEIEAALLHHFSAQKVIWLPYGLLDDLTSGHVDGVCVSIGPGKVLAQVIDPNFPHDAEEARLAANLAVLQSETDAMGRPFDVVEFPILPRANFGGGAYVPHCYINFAFVNGGLIVPLAGMAGPDADALDFLRGLFPNRRVVGVPMPFGTWAGGGVHCITQQLPAVA